MASEFHAVSIKFKSDACAAVKAFEGKRFLSREAQMLPLKECDAANCRCTYVHHEDRREGPRRGSEVGMPDKPPENGERRAKRGRRATD